MIERASQPIPAKPALALVTRSRLLLAATPSTLLLLLCFTLAGEVSSQECSPMKILVKTHLGVDVLHGRTLLSYTATNVSKPNKQKAATTPTQENDLTRGCLGWKLGGL